VVHHAACIGVGEIDGPRKRKGVCWRQNKGHLAGCAQTPDGRQGRCAACL
jgi:hypothetical protein